MTRAAGALGALHARLEAQRGRIVILIVLFVAVYFTVAFAEQAWRARQLQAEVADHHAALAGMATENATLQEQVDRYSTDAYLDYAESRARRDLNLANPGETLALVRWDPLEAPAVAPATTVVSEERGPNWRRWLDVFGE